MNNSIFSKLSYPNKIALSALIFAAATFSLAYWLILPAVNDVAATRIKMEDQSQAAQRDYTQGQNLKKLKDNINAVEPRVSEIEQIFISKNDPQSFVDSLEAAAEKNQVSEKTNSGAETSLGGNYSQIPLQLIVNGSFNGLIGFLTDLETLKKYIDINSMQITAIDSDFTSHPATSTPGKILSAQISATTYWGN